MRAKPDFIPPGSARYFAWLYAGPRRELVSALLDVEHEIETSLRPGLEHQVAHLRLAWWREECDRFKRGAPAHPATRRLRELAEASAPIELVGLVEAAAWDLASAAPENRGELERHCARWARSVIVPLASPASMRESASALGAALREIELLMHLAADASRGRLRVPLDELDALGVEPRALSSPPWPPALATHLRQRYEALRSSVRTGLAGIAEPALHAWSAHANAAAARASRSLPGMYRESALDGIADVVRAWRAARASLRGAVRTS
jgi:15-cis-phytoene synthase